LETLYQLDLNVLFEVECDERVVMYTELVGMKKEAVVLPIHCTQTELVKVFLIKDQRLYSQHSLLAPVSANACAHVSPMSGLDSMCHVQEVGIQSMLTEK
jgi:hypothetical protein